MMMKLRTKAQLKNVRQNHCRQANKKLKIYSSASIAANPMLPVVNFSTDILNWLNFKTRQKYFQIISAFDVAKLKVVINCRAECSKHKISLNSSIKFSWCCKIKRCVYCRAESSEYKISQKFFDKVFLMLWNLKLFYFVEPSVANIKFRKALRKCLSKLTK